MKHYLRIILLTIFLINVIEITFSQQFDNNEDTLNLYLITQCKRLLEPHTNLDFSFATDELKNETPDLNVKVPQLKDSVTYLDELKGDFNDWNVFYKIGKLYQRFNMNQTAFSYYERAYDLIMNEIKKDTLNSGPFAAMGTLYMNLNSRDNAFYFFNRAYELNNQDSVANQFLPMFYIFSGQLDKANLLIDRNIKSQPDDLNSYIWLISARVFKVIANLEKDDKTLINKPIDELFDFSTLNNAVKTNKSDIRFLVLQQLGRQLALFAKYAVLSGNFEKIEISADDNKELKSIRKTLEKFLAKGTFKNKYVLYKALGFNYMLEKNLDKAIELFKKSIANWPADKVSKDYNILFTTYYFLKKDTVKAISVIDEKIANDKKLMLENYGDHNLKGNVYLMQNNFTKAGEEYHRSLEISNNSDACLGLAFLELKDKNLGEANTWINRAYEMNKDYYLPYAMFGIITLMNNQKDAAKDALEKAMKLKPEDKIVEEVYHNFFK